MFIQKKTQLAGSGHEQVVVTKVKIFFFIQLIDKNSILQNQNKTLKRKTERNVGVAVVRKYELLIMLLEN